MPFAKNADTIELLEFPSVRNYIDNTNIMNKSTADEYLSRLRTFNEFLCKEYNNITINTVLEKIKDGTIDTYSILSRYGADQKNNNISSTTIKQRVVTIKNFFEYHDIEVSPRKFKLKVRLPKSVRKNKEALSKEDIADILNNCSDIKLKTYVILLAATGMRATEALHIRIKDIDLNSGPAKLFVRGEYTKTRTDRIVFLTEEVTHQLNSWLGYKYRTRRVSHRDNLTGKTITEIRTPDRNESDLIFAMYQNTKTPNPVYLYTDFCCAFGKTLDRMNKGDREDGN